MSGLAVVFHRDGAPAKDAEIQRMTARVSHRGPDGIGHWTSGPTALGHCALHLLPEDIGQTQPLHSANGLFHLTFDGRLDNREELLSALGLQTSVSDARIVLAAYEKWGEFCPERFLGDFAFALWDDRRQHLFCARDIDGTKPFFYFLSDRLFLAGSERSQLFTNPAVSRTPNEPVICGLLMMAINSETETLHKDVQRLAPATTMIVTDREIRFRRYWVIQEIPPLFLKSEEEYAEQLWSLILEATRCRMRGNGRVAIQMSGGLDSTTVAAAAVEIERSRGGGTDAVETLSLVFPGCPEADESELINLVNQTLGVRGVSFPPQERPLGAYEADVHWYEDLPDYTNDAFANDLRAYARENGRRTVLTGNGGDEWFSGSHYQLLDRLRNGDLLGLLADMRVESRSVGQSIGRYAWRNLIRPMVPPILVQAIRRCRSPSSHASRWIHPDLAARSDLGRFCNVVTPFQRRRSVHHELLNYYERGHLAFGNEMHERLNSRYTVEFRSPLNDRRVIEFALGIPDEKKRVGRTTKVVLRRSGAGKLPSQITDRLTKSHFANVLIRDLRNHARVLVDCDLEIVRRSWVRADAVREFMEKVLATPTQTPYCPPMGLWHAFGLELLIRAKLL